MSRMLKALQQLESRGAWSPATSEPGKTADDAAAGTPPEPTPPVEAVRPPAPPSEEDVPADTAAAERDEGPALPDSHVSASPDRHAIPSSRPSEPVGGYQAGGAFHDAYFDPYRPVAQPSPPAAAANRPAAQQPPPAVDAKRPEPPVGRETPLPPPDAQRDFDQTHLVSEIESMVAEALANNPPVPDSPPAAESSPSRESPGEASSASSPPAESQVEAPPLIQPRPVARAAPDVSPPVESRLELPIIELPEEPSAASASQSPEPEIDPGTTETMASDNVPRETPPTDEPAGETECGSDQHPPAETPENSADEEAEVSSGEALEEDAAEVVAETIADDEREAVPTDVAPTPESPAADEGALEASAESPQQQPEPEPERETSVAKSEESPVAAAVEQAVSAEHGEPVESAEPPHESETAATPAQPDRSQSEPANEHADLLDPAESPQPPAGEAPALQVRFDGRLRSAPSQPTKLEREAALDLIEPQVARPYQEMVGKLLEQTTSPHATLAFASAANEPHLADTVARVALELPRRDRGKVLLIDGDLTEKRLSLGFDLAGELGLAEVLKQSELWHQVIQPAYTRGLYLLPAGRAHFSGEADPAALRKLAAQLKQHWSLVLFAVGSLDSPLAMNLCAVCDNTYLLVRLGETSTDAVEDAVASLRERGARLSGCVATNAVAG